MKINNGQNNLPLKFTGFIKCSKKIPTISIINPTPEDLIKLEEKSKTQIEKLGLKIIKEVKLSIGNINKKL
ncbi:MAG: hypothetical protein NC191_10440 [Muribaculaceae bacterium]|nr:hypothetical protein [Muribaculaceae bacterium]